MNQFLIFHNKMLNIFNENSIFSIKNLTDKNTLFLDKVIQFQVFFIVFFRSQFAEMYLT
jgi:hypothetical protein